VGAGAAIAKTKTGGDVTSAMAAVAPALMVLAAIYFMGAVSGAHLNPVVTFAFAVRGNFPWYRVPGYLIAQFVGALIAVLILRSLFDAGGHLGATIPKHGVTAIQAVIIETILTAGLVNTILGTASGARNIGTNAGIAVGAYIALAGLWAEPLTGASMNLARSLAPDVIRWNFSTSWIYIVGPVTGALIGVIFEWILKGPPTAAGSKAAQGVEE
jgi:aquaporin Z